MTNIKENNLEDKLGSIESSLMGINFLIEATKSVVNCPLSYSSVYSQILLFTIKLVTKNGLAKHKIY